MDVHVLFQIELVILHTCLCENFFFRNDQPPKAGFGEYVIDLQSFLDCNSTEKTDQLLLNSLKMNFIAKDSEENSAYASLKLKENRILSKSYFLTELWKYGKFSKLFVQTSDNPCTDPMGKKILALIDGVESKPQCSLKAGNFTTPVKRPNEILHQLIGNKFFYGLGRVTSKFYSEEGLGFCYVVTFASKPKTNKKAK